jgi:hypothetical protein
MEFLDAAEPKRLAKEHFIGEQKPHWHLKDCNILWLYQDKGSMKNGFSISRASKLWNHITGFDIVIRILVGAWDEHKADQQEVAFVDHLLTHIELTETDKYKINAPSVQEFVEVVQRHGAWRPPVNEMVQAQRNSQ